MGILCCLPCYWDKSDEYEANYHEARGRCDLPTANYWMIRRIHEQYRSRSYKNETGIENAIEIRFHPNIDMDERALPYLQEWPAMFSRVRCYYTACIGYWLQSLILYRLGRREEALEAADLAARAAVLNLTPETEQELQRDGYHRDSAKREAADRAARWRPRIRAFEASRDDMRAAIKAADPADPSHDCYGRPLAEPAGQI